MDGGVELLRGFLSEEDRAKYLDWLWTDSNHDDGICRSIERWMQDNVTFVPLGVVASMVAERELLGVDVE